MNSGQRSRIGFIGSIVTHIFILLFVSFVGLFNLSHPPANDIVEVSLFGGGGGGGNAAGRAAGSALRRGRTAGGFPQRRGHGRPDPDAGNVDVRLGGVGNPGGAGVPSGYPAGNRAKNRRHHGRAGHRNGDPPPRGRQDLSHRVRRMPRKTALGGVAAEGHGDRLRGGARRYASARPAGPGTGNRPGGRGTRCRGVRQLLDGSRHLHERTAPAD